MASTIDATVGGTASNSYVTMDEATTYFGDRLHKDAWANASVTDKTAALLWATKIIDSRIYWAGNKADSLQALSWPRLLVPDPDPAYIPSISLINGFSTAGYLPGDAIPVDIKTAQCEMAMALISSDLTAEPGSTGLNSLAVGSLKLDFADNRSQPETFPRQVDEIITKYGTIRSAKTAVRKLVRS